MTPPSERHRNRQYTRSRSIQVFGHKTTIRLEPEYWMWLGEIAATLGVRKRYLIEVMGQNKSPKASLSSALRVWITNYFYRAQQSRKRKFTDV